MHIINRIIDLQTAATLDFIDITDRIHEKLKDTEVANGIVNIQSLHTTMAIIVNEAEPLLHTDIKAMLERLAPHTAQYMHDNFAVRTVNMTPDERENGHSHCQALHLPVAHTLNVLDHKLQLGRWQRVFAIELDCPRPRQIALQVIGA